MKSAAARQSHQTATGKKLCTTTSEVRRFLEAIARKGHIRVIRTIGEDAGSEQLFGVFETDDRLSLPKRRIDRERVDQLLSAGLIEPDGDVFRITSAGRSRLRREREPVDSYREQHWEKGALETNETGSREQHLANAAENPLMWLFSRKGPQGRTLIDTVQYRAGTRLHGDFCKAGIHSVSSVRWGQSLSGKKRKAGQSGRSEPGDQRLDALARFRTAVNAVGPELSGVLIDVCCLEVGLGEIEKRNNWPRRSAKVVLDLGLSRLARHYGLLAECAAKNSGVRHWGTSDYRPEIGAD